MFCSLITLSPLNLLYTFALMLSPIANGLEELIPTEKLEKHGRRIVTIIVRTLLLLSTLLVATMVPFFGKFVHSSFLCKAMNTIPPSYCAPLFDLLTGYMMSLVGSVLSMLVVSFHKCIKFHLI